MLSPKNTQAVLTRIDEELVRVGEKRSLIICGAGALIALNIIERQTRDIDVISPKIDAVLGEIAIRIGKEFGLSEKWLNNGPESLTKDLESGWQKRTLPVFEGKGLELRSLGREDLIASKLFAFCDREDDFEDVQRLQPSREELDKLFSWVLNRDSSIYWPKRVEACFSRLRKILKYE